ncbi:MAG: hypothetical protein KAT43_05865 [Nanoarchaeota archaeon]|nr:hypothetical protein [Nanoarchaeota archaeon]
MANTKIKCKCGGKIVSDKTLIEGFLVDCLKCQKCDEILFSPKQAKDVLRLREKNKRIEAKRKIIKVGSSIAAILPKKIEDFGVKEGMIDTIRILSSNSLEIKFKKDLF